MCFTATKRSWFYETVIMIEREDDAFWRKEAKISERGAVIETVVEQVCSQYNNILTHMQYMRNWWMLLLAKMLLLLLMMMVWYGGEKSKREKKSLSFILLTLVVLSPFPLQNTSIAHTVVEVVIITIIPF